MTDLDEAQKKARELTQSLARLCRPVEQPRYILIADKRGHMIGCAPPQRFAGLDSIITTGYADDTNP